MNIDTVIDSYVRQLYAWAFSERIGRRRYVHAVVKIGLTGFLVAFTPLFVMFLLPDIDTEAPAFIATLIAVLAVAGMALAYTAASLARLRDMRQSQWWMAAGLVPYVNIVFFVWLAFTEGEKAKPEKRAAE